MHKPEKPAPEPAPHVERRIAEEALVLRDVVLQVAAPIAMFVSTLEAAAQAPLDRLSNHLLNPPSPQFRLAFRTNVAASDL